MTKPELLSLPETQALHRTAIQFEEAIQIFASLHGVQPEKLFPVAEFYKLVDAVERKSA